MTRGIEMLPQVAPENSWLLYRSIDEFVDLVEDRAAILEATKDSLQILNETEHRVFIAKLAQRLCSTDQPRGMVEINEKFGNNNEQLVIGEVLYLQAKGYLDRKEKRGSRMIKEYRDFCVSVSTRLLGISEKKVTLTEFDEVVRYVAQY